MAHKQLKDRVEGTEKDIVEIKVAIQGIKKNLECLTMMRSNLAVKMCQTTLVCMDSDTNTCSHLLE